MCVLHIVVLAVGVPKQSEILFFYEFLTFTQNIEIANNFLWHGISDRFQTSLAYVLHVSNGFPRRKPPEFKMNERVKFPLCFSLVSDVIILFIIRSVLDVNVPN